jgi:hypothetical protein
MPRRMSSRLSVSGSERWPGPSLPAKFLKLTVTGRVRNDHGSVLYVEGAGFSG